jgi:glutamate formiminotransferase/formiminotetrahydrofolate cyclodeaminase
MTPLVECVPNFSEGRDRATLDAIRNALLGVPGVRLLDVQADPDHHRSVFTFVAPPEAAVEAAFRAAREAVRRIDLRTHRGEHPRMGAVDVIPFVPLRGTSMDECITLARTLGEKMGRELEIPVFLYERAATRPGRANLAEVRRGEFEGLREAIGSDPARDPDFGPRRVHPSAGATAVGARPFLVAYNVYLRGGDESLAKSVAKAVRASSGGLPAVKALGLTVGGEPQVSMNLVDIDTTPVHRAFEAVREEARRAGADAAWSEIVGLVPERTVHAAAETHLMLREPISPHVLEERVRESAGPFLGEFLDSVASASPAPGGGTAAATAGALAAALIAMVARLTVGRARYAQVEPEFRTILERAESLRITLVRLGEEDAAAFEAVTAAYRIPKDREPERRRAVQAALMEACRVPLDALRAAREVAALAARGTESGNRNAVSDAGVAALLAVASARGAAYNLRINTAAMPEPAESAPLVEEARRLVQEAIEDGERAARAVDAALTA